MPDFIQVEEAVDIIDEFITELAIEGGSFEPVDLYDQLRRKGHIITVEEDS